MKVVHFKKGKYDVYIGRPNGRYRLKGSIWANPFVVGKDGTRCSYKFRKATKDRNTEATIFQKIDAFIQAVMASDSHDFEYLFPNKEKARLRPYLRVTEPN